MKACSEYEWPEVSAVRMEIDSFLRKPKIEGLMLDCSSCFANIIIKEMACTSRGPNLLVGISRAAGRWALKYGRAGRRIQYRMFDGC